MTIDFRILIDVSDIDNIKTHEIRSPQGFPTTKIIFTTDELSHYKEFGYILRPNDNCFFNYKKGYYWFYSNIEYNLVLSNNRDTSWIYRSHSKIVELIYSNKEQIKTDVNLYDEYGSFYY